MVNIPWVKALLLLLLQDSPSPTSPQFIDFSKNLSEISEAYSLEFRMLDNNLSKAKRLIQNGSYSEALGSLNEMIDQPDSPPIEAYRLRALCLTTLDFQNYSGALEDINRVIDSDQSDAQDYVIRANILDKLGRRIEGRIDLVTAIGLDPNYESMLRTWDNPNVA
jgi:tetratricopeptide (TPR) repeat protein